MGKKRKDNPVDDISSKVDRLNNEVRQHNENFDKNYKKRVWKIDYSKYLRGQPYDNFLNTVTNPSTKEGYRLKLYKVCEKLNTTTEELYLYSDELKNKKDTIELESKLRDIINKFKVENSSKEYDHHAGVIHLEFYAFKKFCDANRIKLNFDWLKLMLPKIDNKGSDKGYTKKQIASMLLVSDVRSRLIILIFATSAMREGALCNLRVQDITAMPEGATKEKIEGVKIVIYRGDKDQDFAFITPESYEALTAYLDARRELGEDITPTSPLLLRRIPKDRKKGWVETKCISESTIGNILVNVAVRAGIRKLSTDYTYSNRYTTKITTGFRKFAKTTMMGARNKNGTHKMNPYFADRLLSHKRRGGIPVARHYDESEIFEDYKRVIPDLTFSKEAEYKAKLDDATGKLEGVEHTKTYIKQKEKEMNERTEAQNKKIAELEHESLDLLKQMLMQNVKYEQTLGLAATDPEKFLQVIKDGRYAKILKQKLNPDEIEAQTAKVLMKK